MNRFPTTLRMRADSVSEPPLPRRSAPLPAPAHPLAE